MARDAVVERRSSARATPRVAARSESRAGHRSRRLERRDGRAGAATSLGFRRARDVANEDGIERCEWNASSEAMSRSVLDAATTRAVAKVAALRAANGDDEERRAAVEDALRAVDLVVSSAKEEVKSAMRSVKRERARAKELREELARETRRSVKAETDARELRCDLECARTASTCVDVDGASRITASDDSNGLGHTDDDDDSRVRRASQSSSECASASPRTERELSEVASSLGDADVVASLPVFVTDLNRECGGGETGTAVAGRDRHVDDDDARFFADTEALDSPTTHRLATLIAIELALSYDSSMDVSHRVREFFYKRHGSRTLGDKHHQMFTKALATINAQSEWVQTFTRFKELDAFELERVMSTIRFTQHVLIESPQTAPILGVEEATRSLAHLLAPVLGEAAPSTEDVDVIRRSATHRNGISRVSFALVIERGLVGIVRARTFAREAIAATFAKRHPYGTLAHHPALVKTLSEAFKSAGAIARAMLNDDDMIDRVAADIARRDASTQDFVTLECFVHVASRELERSGVSKASDVVTPLRPHTGPSPPKVASNSIRLVSSLALVAHAWSMAAAVVDRWLQKCAADARRPPAPTAVHRTAPSIATGASRAPNPPNPPLPQPIDASKRRLIKRHVGRLAKLRATADFAVRAAQSLARRADATSDVDRAWQTYASTVCAFEAAFLARRRSLGVVEGALADCWRPH
jgi:hypothetical protein|tara:strand:- start:6341 stop:8458 length:2118 start_codon:yes stop_codon:yes gene_type:complete